MKPPAAAAQTEQPQFDNIQLLLQRKADLARNKAKYSLTETDAQLLSTHATEVHFEDGQVIQEEYQDIDAVYRIKSGQVAVSRNGFHFNTIGKGWFIGDPMFIYETPAYAVKVTLKSIGHVVLDRLDLAFVKQLFTIDHILHAKVMRHLVAKYSVLFENLINNLDSPYARYKPLEPTSGSSSSAGSPSLTPSTSSSDLNPDTAKILTAEISNTHELTSSDSISSINSFSSDSSVSSTSSNTTPSSPAPSPSTAAVGAPAASKYITSENHPRLSKREARARDHAAYKSYPLQARGGGIQTLNIKSKKLTVVAKSFGFSFKTTIEYSKILNITKVGENAVTIVYSPRKVANVFFKQYYDREEFIGIVNSLTNTSPKSPEVSKRHSGQSLTAPHNPELSYDEVPLCGGKGECCESLATTQVFKKGEVVFEEGDLFQRVYTLTKGHCEIYMKGKKICTMEEGDIFGVGTLLHLRPVPVTLKAGSESVELMVVPAYKLNALIETDAAQAAIIYREAARAVDRKISQAMGFLPNYKRMLREAKEKREAEDKEENVTAAVATPEVVAN